MTFLPKSPLEKLVYFQDEVDRLFHMLFDSTPASSEVDIENFPQVDVYEEGGKIHFEFEVPDISKEEIILSISNDLIVVEGVKDESIKEGITNYICMERTFGKFQRIIKIPSIVDSRQAKAKYKDGILTVSFPMIKERRTRSKKITIE